MLFTHIVIAAGSFLIAAALPTETAENIEYGSHNQTLEPRSDIPRNVFEVNTGYDCDADGYKISDTTHCVIARDYTDGQPVHSIYVNYLHDGCSLTTWSLRDCSGSSKVIWDGKTPGSVGGFCAPVTYAAFNVHCS